MKELNLLELRQLPDIFFLPTLNDKHFTHPIRRRPNERRPRNAGGHPVLATPTGHSLAVSISLDPPDSITLLIPLLKTNFTVCLPFHQDPLRFDYPFNSASSPAALTTAPSAAALVATSIAFPFL
jgi:hypothetical protein